MRNLSLVIIVQELGVCQGILVVMQVESPECNLLQLWRAGLWTARGQALEKGKLKPDTSSKNNNHPSPFSGVRLWTAVQGPIKLNQQEVSNVTRWSDYILKDMRVNTIQELPTDSSGGNIHRKRHRLDPN